MSNGIFLDDEAFENYKNEKLEYLYQYIRIAENKSSYYNEQLNYADANNDIIGVRKYDTILSLLHNIDVYDEQIFQYLESLDDAYIMRFHRFVELYAVYLSYNYAISYGTSRYDLDSIKVYAIDDVGNKTLLDKLFNIMASIEPLDNAYLSLDNLKEICQIYDTDNRIGFIIEENVVTDIISEKANKKPTEFLGKSENLFGDFV